MAQFGASLIAIAIILASIPAAAPQLPLGASTVSVPITSNARLFLKVWAAANESSTPTWPHVVALQHARSFNLLSANKDTYRAHVQTMKQAHPNLLLLSYVMGTFAWKTDAPGQRYPVAWYLRDKDGNFVRMKGDRWSGHYLMNPAHTGWIKNRISTCRDFMAYSGYEGCMLDLLGVGAINARNLVTAKPINPATARPWTDAQWHAATGSLAARVKRSLGAEAVVLGNGLRSGESYFGNAPSRRIMKGIDGGIAEAWLRGAGQPITSYRAEALWKKDVDMLVDSGQRGKRIGVLVKTWAAGSAAQKDAWHRYALATFLLGSDGTASFGFSPDAKHEPTEPHPYWNTDLGLPLGPYEKTGNVYRRSFTQGQVLVNPRAEAVSFRLDGPYRDLDNRVRLGTIRLAPREGLLLTRP